MLPHPAQVNPTLMRGLDGGTLDISSGAVTVDDGGRYLIDTESDASADNLDSITGVDGQVVWLRGFNSGRITTIKHGTGNISLPGAKDLELPSDSFIGLINENNTWRQISGAGGGGIWDTILDKDTGTITGSDATFSVSGIPTGYAALWISMGVLSDRAGGSDTGALLTLNSDTSTNYTYRWIDSAGGAPAIASGQTSINLGYTDAYNSGSQADRMTYIDIMIYGYDSTSILKQITSTLAMEANNRTYHGYSNWQPGTIAAISSFQLAPNQGTYYKVGSWVMVRGLKES